MTLTALYRRSDQCAEPKARAAVTPDMSLRPTGSDMSLRHITTRLRCYRSHRDMDAADDTKPTCAHPRLPSSPARPTRPRRQRRRGRGSAGVTEGDYRGAARPACGLLEQPTLDSASCCTPTLCSNTLSVTPPDHPALQLTCAPVNCNYNELYNYRTGQDYRPGQAPFTAITAP